MATGTPLDSGNGRTLAVVVSKLDELKDEVRRLADRMERRTNFLEEKLDIRCGEIDGEAKANAREIEKIAKANAQEIAVLTERLNTRTGIFGVVQAIGLTAATILGVKF